MAWRIPFFFFFSALGAESQIYKCSSKEHLWEREDETTALWSHLPSLTPFFWVTILLYSLISVLFPVGLLFVSATFAQWLLHFKNLVLWAVCICLDYLWLRFLLFSNAIYNTENRFAARAGCFFSSIMFPVWQCQECCYHSQYSPGVSLELIVIFAVCPVVWSSATLEE